MNPSLLRDHSWHEACVSSQFTRHLYCPGGQPSGLPEAGCHTGPPVAFGEVSGELLTGFTCLSRSVCTYSPELFVCVSQLGPSWVLLWSHSLRLALACADGLVRIWPSAAVLRVRVPGVQQGHPSPQPLSLPGRFHVCPAASFLLAALLRWPWSLLARARAEGALLGMGAVWTRSEEMRGLIAASPLWGASSGRNVAARAEQTLALSKARQATWRAWLQNSFLFSFSFFPPLLNRTGECNT